MRIQWAGVPYLAGLDGPNVRFGNEQDIGGMRFPHVELHGNTALATEEVNKHAHVAALEVQIFKAHPFRCTDVSN
ncbi:MAG: hypothetical protein F4X66_01230 [Chloroflexi bacterium]|nr:hypothetical protein [Chloroflexota bacterium]MYE40190.1 hypothetical protein [Chloroflexota bacterium]